MKIFAYTIFYNNVHTLRAAIASILPHVDFYLAIDGNWEGQPSTDGSIEIVQELQKEGWPLYYCLASQTSLSDKRNLAAKCAAKVDPDWFWTRDSDEVTDPNETSDIRETLDTLPEEVSRIQFQQVVFTRCFCHIQPAFTEPVHRLYRYLPGTMYNKGEQLPQWGKTLNLPIQLYHYHTFLTWEEKFQRLYRRINELNYPPELHSFFSHQENQLEPFEGTHPELMQPTIHKWDKEKIKIHQRGPNKPNWRNIEETARWIRLKGSSDHRQFQATFTGGWLVQQDPNELAELLAWLHGFKARKFLEIGTAAGGTHKILRTFFEPHLEASYWIDLGTHSQFKEILPPNVSPPCIGHIGCSHSEEAHEFVHENRPFDFILIDGDHSEEGILADLNLARTVISPGGYICVHDSWSIESVSNAIRHVICQGTLKEVWKTIHLCGLTILQIIDD